MSALVLGLPGYTALAARLAESIGSDTGQLDFRRFPDGESYVRISSSVAGQDVVVAASLDRPDPKVIPLLFALETARELGARSVGLVAPYLSYMRQDRRFLEGEAVAARLFARVLSRSTDWIVTVDPHLHRIHDLSEVYAVPTRVVHAAGAIAAWVATNVERPLFVGPDEESEQWVSDVAARASSPCVVLRKIRRSDRDVEVSVPEVDRWREHTPVLVDDIVSTGRTLIETIGHLKRAGMRPPVCVAVHGIFADGSAEGLAAEGATVITCNTVIHPTNAIDLVPELAEAITDMLTKGNTP
jgi:ribose-phosphate pyrophosphokinase